MMGGKTPETCLAINKRQDNKIKLLHQVSDLFELNIKPRRQKVKEKFCNSNAGTEIRNEKHNQDNKFWGPKFKTLTCCIRRCYIPLRQVEWIKKCSPETY
jgi:hypothetical protein